MRPLRPRKIPAEAIVLVTTLIAGALHAQTEAETKPEDPAPAAPAAPAEPPVVVETPEQKLKRGKSLFAYRDCPGTIVAINELAIPGQLSEEKDQLEVHRMLGICHALGDTPEQKREASREFSSLLSIDPDFQLDPFEVPPPVIDLFEAQKNAMKARLDEIRKARAKEEPLVDGGILVERMTTTRVVPLPVAFVPFGLNQVANGDLVLGAVLGGVQGAALATNVIGFWGAVAVQAGANDEDGYPADEVQNEIIFTAVWVVGLSALILTYAVSVGEALITREGEMILAEKQTKRPLTPAELKKLKRIERAPDPAPDAPTTTAQP